MTACDADPAVKSFSRNRLPLTISLSCDGFETVKVGL